MPALVGLGTRRLKIIIATWHVQGLRSPAKYGQFVSFMKQFKVDLLFLQETWQTLSSQFVKTVPTNPPQSFLGFLLG